MTSSIPLPTWKAVLNFLRELRDHTKTEVCIKPTTDQWNVEVKSAEKRKKLPTRKTGIGVALYDLSW